MNTITIPQKTFLNKDLVAVPRNLYGEFLVWQEIVKSKKTFKPSLDEKKAISRGRQEIIKGDYITLEELTYELAGKNIQSRKKKS